MQFVLQVDLIVGAVSLFTIIMLWILDVPVPRALILIFIISVLLLIISLIINQIIKYKNRK